MATPLRRGLLFGWSRPRPLFLPLTVFSLDGKTETMFFGYGQSFFFHRISLFEFSVYSSSPFRFHSPQEERCFLNCHRFSFFFRDSLRSSSLSADIYNYYSPTPFVRRFLFLGDVYFRSPPLSLTLCVQRSSFFIAELVFLSLNSDSGSRREARMTLSLFDGTNCPVSLFICALFRSRIIFPSAPKEKV